MVNIQKKHGSTMVFLYSFFGIDAYLHAKISKSAV